MRKLQRSSEVSVARTEEIKEKYVVLYGVTTVNYKKEGRKLGSKEGRESSGEEGEGRGEIK